MQRTYHVDLGDLWRGQLSLRRLRVLASHLPPDSATAQAVSGNDDGPLTGWALTDVLLGRVADELALLRWQWESAHLDTKKSRPRKQPPSVLPDLSGAPTAPTDTDRVPVVSPHRLGAFLDDNDDS